MSSDTTLRTVHVDHPTDLDADGSRAAPSRWSSQRWPRSTRPFPTWPAIPVQHRASSRGSWTGIRSRWLVSCCPAAHSAIDTVDENCSCSDYSFLLPARRFRSSRTNPSWIIVSRVISGVGAAFVMPATLSLLTAGFPPAQRARAVGVWSGVAGSGAIAGLVVSGLLLEKWSWHSIFVSLAVVSVLNPRVCRSRS